jgi:pre-mRNA-splicing factor 38A
MLKVLLGGYALTFMDEFVYALLVEERVCDIILPRLIKRQVLEENGDIGPRKSRLLDAMEGKSDQGSDKSRSQSRSRSRSQSKSRSTSPASSGYLSAGRTPSAGSRYVSRSPSGSRSPSPSPIHSGCRSVSLDRMDMDK